MRVIIQEKLVVGYWELVPMESGADNSSDYDTSTVIKGLEEPQSKQKRTLWWKEENCPSLNKSMERRRNPAVNGVCDAACLDLGEDTVPRQTVTIFCKGLETSQSHTIIPSPQ